MLESLLTGLVSGIISGLIVAALLWLLNHLRKPPLELVHLSEHRALLKNNQLRPVVIGGSWELCNGSVLYRPDGFRGGTGGFYIPRLAEIVVGTRYFAPGQTADIAYRPVKRPRNPDEIIRLEEANIVDVSAIASQPEDFPGWRIERVPLRGAA